MEGWQHLSDLADFALSMKVTLNNLNKQSFNNFMLRIGLYTSVILTTHARTCIFNISIDVPQVLTKEEF